MVSMYNLQHPTLWRILFNPLPRRGDRISFSPIMQWKRLKTNNKTLFAFISSRFCLSLWYFRCMHVDFLSNCSLCEPKFSWIFRYWNRHLAACKHSRRFWYCNFVHLYGKRWNCYKHMLLIFVLYDGCYFLNLKNWFVSFISLFIFVDC